jgi:hypothetical protein
MLYTYRVSKNIVGKYLTYLGPLQWPDELGRFRQNNSRGTPPAMALGVTPRGIPVRSGASGSEKWR